MLCPLKPLSEAQVLIYTLQSKFLKYYIGPAQWSAQMHCHRIPSACAQSKDLWKSTPMQYLARKMNSKYQITFCGNQHQKNKLLVNRALRVMAVSSRKGVGYGQLVEPEQTTVQTLVHPPVTAGTTGRWADSIVFTAICILFSMMLFNFTFSIITLRQLL